MLAMLFEMTWTLRSCAAIPDAAMSSARMMMFPYRAAFSDGEAHSTVPECALGRNGGELLERGGALGVLLLQEVGDLLVGAGDLDHARHLGHRAHVRLLDGALHHAHVRPRRLRRDAGRGRKQVRPLLLERSGIVEVSELQLPARGIGGGAGAFADRDGAVLADGDI